MKNTTNTLVARDFLSLTAPTHNIYETVAIISKRARQLAMYMKEDLDRKLADFITEDIEEIQDEEKAGQEEQAAITRLYERLPKPIIVATEEFLAKELMYRYLDEDLKPAS
jgi:DNA-directed RNA polymerase subunit K/omega